jgi:hypothetical protein
MTPQGSGIAAFEEKAAMLQIVVEADDKERGKHGLYYGRNEILS